METKTETTIRDFIQDEALDIAAQHQACTLVVSMGVGKTLIGLRDWARERMPGQLALVVAPKTSIFESWKNDAQKFGFGDLLESIDFVTYLSLNKRDLSLYRKIYLDEVHRLKYTHSNHLNDYKTNHSGKILGLTGTPSSDEHSESYRMVKYFAPIVYEYKTDDAVNSKILNDYKIVVHLIALDESKTVRLYTKDKKRSWLTSEADNYAYWSEKVSEAFTPAAKKQAGIMRTNGMKNYPSKERFAKWFIANRIKEKCLVFATSKEQADRLCGFSYYSGNKNSKYNMELFSEGTIEVMSCIDQLTEGINIPGLKEGLIVHCFGSEFKTSQKIGRLLRLNPDDICTAHIICFKDTVDMQQVQNALEQFDKSKITWLDYTRKK